MADGLSIEIESLPLERALLMWKKELGAAYPAFLRSESKKAMKEIIKGTPIFKFQGKQKEIRVDLRKSVDKINPDGITNIKIRDLLLKRDFAHLNKIFANMKAGGFRGKRVVPFNKKLHRPFSPNFSKPRRRHSNIVTPDVKQWDKFRDELYGRLGLMKAGWTQTAIKLGLKVPKYVSRHTSARASADYKEKFSADESFISMTNRKIRFKESSLKFLIERSLFIRARAMEGLLRRVVSGKAAKVGFVTKGGVSITKVFNA